MKVLIIEDEPFAQKEIARLLALCDPGIQIIEYLDSIEDSVEWLKTNARPDLIFMDIQLADGLSFEIFNQVQVMAPVVFTTAYDEYAIRAFKVNSIDYLLKPVEEEALQAALLKFEKMKQQYSEVPKPTYLSTSQIDQLLRLGKSDYKTRFVSVIGDKIKHVGVEQIAYFFADDNTVYLVTLDRKKLIINYTLDDLEPLLDPRQFFRVNRKYLAKISAIGDVNKYFNSRLKITLLPPVEDEVLVSRRRVQGFLEWMDG